MFTRIAIAAGLTSALLVAAVAAVPANAGSGHSAFCKAGSPTPKYVCDAIKSAEKNKPHAGSGQVAGAKLAAPVGRSASPVIRAAAPARR